MGVQVLGPVSVTGARNLGPRDRVVLAALAIHPGQAVAAELLAEALWGENIPKSWAKVVQGTIVRLRRILGARAIETVPGGYALTIEPTEVDARHFEDLLERAEDLASRQDAERAVAVLDTALQLWRGHPFPDLDGWAPARAAATRLEEKRRSAEEARLECRLASGHQREAAAEGEVLVAEEPYRERRWALLAVAQYRDGRQGEALRTISRARRVLAEELGLTPGPDLVDLEQAILNQDPALAPPEVSSGTASDRCPYPGLVSFGVDDTELFFGRSQEVDRCIRRLSDTPFLAILGASGSGKSSLLRAGIAPALKGQGRTAAIITPGNDPFGALSGAPVTDGTPLLVDQLEETFNSADPGTVRAFLGYLERHAEETGPVVVTLRADHLADASSVPSFARLLESGLHLIAPMTEAELRSAIEGPANAAGLRIEPGFVELLLRDVLGEPGALPLLSYALAETWARREGRVLTVEGYLSTGGIREAVARSAERLYGTLPPHQRDVVRLLLLRLVGPNEDGSPVRYRVLRQALTTEPDHALVLDTLVRARLVIAGDESVEIAHEALAVAWPRLRDWLDDDREGQRIQRHLSAAAEGWESMGRDNGELYSANRLRAAEEWVSASQPALTVIEQSFLDASRGQMLGAQMRAEKQAVLQARQNRRLRGALTAVAAVLIVALVAGSIAVQQRDRARASTRSAALRGLITQSLALRDGQPDLAALLAAAAYHLSPSAATEGALLSSIDHHPAFLGFLRLDSHGFVGGRALPDGDLLLIERNGGTPREIDPARGADAGRPFPAPGSPNFEADDFDVTPDGKTVAVAVTALSGSDAPPSKFELAVYDDTSRSLRVPPIALPFRAGAVALSVHGDRVAVAGGRDGAAIEFDVATGHQIDRIPGLPVPAGAPHLHRNTAGLRYGDGDTLFLGSQAGPIRELLAGREVGRLLGPPGTSTGSIHLGVGNNGTRLLISAGFPGGMTAFDLASGRIAWTEPTYVECSAISQSDQANQIYCMDGAGAPKVFDVTTGAPSDEDLMPWVGQPSALVLSGDGRTVFRLGFQDGNIARYSRDGTGLDTHVLEPSRDGSLSAGPYSADGRMVLLSSSSGGPSEVLDAATGQVIERLDNLQSPQWTGQPDRLSATFPDGTVGWFDVRQRRRVSGVSLQSPANAVASTVDPSGTRLAVFLGGDQLEIISSVGVSPLRLPHSGTVNGMSFSTDGNTLAVSQLTGTALFDLRVPSRPAREMARVQAVAMGGHVIAGVDAGGTLRFYDSMTLGLLGPAVGGSFDPSAPLSISNDGRLVLAGGADVRLHLYDVASAVEIGDGFAESSGTVPGGYLAPHGSGVVLDDDPFGVAVWNLGPLDLERAGCRLAARDITRAEWSRYLGTFGRFQHICNVQPS